MNAPAKKTILVTGAAGSLAQRVMARLHGRYRVIAVDFRRRVITDADITSYKIDADAAGFESIFRNHRIDAVMHLGRVFAHESTRRSRYNANVLGTKHLLECCRLHGVTQVLIHSTYYVYGATRFNPQRIDEEAPLKASEVTQDLVDAVELESLVHIYQRKYPELRITTLRPCNVLGPGVRNSLSLLLGRPVAPVLLGYSPALQLVHVDDMADALVKALIGNRPGVYNVAPDESVAYQEALRLAGCRRAPILSHPTWVPRLLTHTLRWNTFFPPYLINYFKYPVLLDGRLFRETFDWRPTHDIASILAHYRHGKSIAA